MIWRLKFEIKKWRAWGPPFRPLHGPVWTLKMLRTLPSYLEDADAQPPGDAIADVRALDEAVLAVERFDTEAAEFVAAFEGSFARTVADVWVDGLPFAAAMISAGHGTRTA